MIKPYAEPVVLERCDMWILYSPVFDIGTDGFSVFATTGEELAPGLKRCVILDDWPSYVQPPDKWLHLEVRGLPLQSPDTLENLLARMYAGSC